MQNKRYHWILSDVNIIRCSKKRYHGIFSDVNIIRCSKQMSLNFVWCWCRQMHKSSYHWMSWDANIVRCRKKLSWNSHCLYRYRTTAINEYSLMLILSDAGNRRHLILSIVNIVRYIKTAITEFCLMLISSEAEKQIPLKLIWC